jgi:hypothetical protein
MGLHTIVAALLLFALLTLIGFILGTAFLASAHEWAVFYRLEQGGVSIEGEVTDRRAKFNGKGNDYYITYSFHVGAQGKRYQREAQVSLRNYRGWIKGTTIQIKFLVDNPTVSRLSEDNFRRANTSYLAFAVFVIAAYLLGVGGILGFAIVWLIAFRVNLLRLANLQNE